MLLVRQKSTDICPSCWQGTSSRMLNSKSLTNGKSSLKDPVAISITWALYELSRHPEAVKKLRNEIGDMSVRPCPVICQYTDDFPRAGFSNPPNAPQLKEMAYLKNVIRETIRLYHPREYKTSRLPQLTPNAKLVGFNIREALNDTTLPVGGGKDGRQVVGILM